MKAMSNEKEILSVINQLYPVQESESPYFTTNQVIKIAEQYAEHSQQETGECTVCHKPLIDTENVNCHDEKPQPTEDVEALAIETGIRPAWDADTENGHEAFFKIGVQTFSVNYVGTKEEAEFAERMLNVAFSKIKGYQLAKKKSC